MNKPKELVVIGRAEKVDFPDLGTQNVPAKIDTGADASSLWASSVELKDDGLHCVFFDPTKSYSNNLPYIFPTSEFETTRVSNSFGTSEIRYKVKLRLKIKGRTIRGTFTLANRATKLYPVLIGRKLLQGKFLVDVSIGDPLTQEERAQAAKLRKVLQDLNKETSV